MFELKNNEIVLDPNYLLIPEFEVIYTRDSTPNKEVARQELMFIYFMSDYKSIYNEYLSEDKEPSIIRDFIKIPNWRPDEKVRVAIDRYLRDRETFSLKFLKSNIKTCEKLMLFLDQVNLHDCDTHGKPLYKPNDIAMTLERTAKILDSLNKLRETVEKEMKGSNKVRANREISDRER